MALYAHSNCSLVMVTIGRVDDVLRDGPFFSLLALGARCIVISSVVRGPEEYLYIRECSRLPTAGGFFYSEPLSTNRVGHFTWSTVTSYQLTLLWEILEEPERKMICRCFLPNP